MVKIQNVDSRLHRAILNMTAVETAKSRRQLDLTEFLLNHKANKNYIGDSFTTNIGINKQPS